jgi:hypothetical protein
MWGAQSRPPSPRARQATQTCWAGSLGLCSNGCGGGCSDFGCSLPGARVLRGWKGHWQLLIAGAVRGRQAHACFRKRIAQPWRGQRARLQLRSAVSAPAGCAGGAGPQLQHVDAGLCFVLHLIPAGARGQFMQQPGCMGRSLGQYEWSCVC